MDDDILKTLEATAKSGGARDRRGCEYLLMRSEADAAFYSDDINALFDCYNKLAATVKMDDHAQPISAAVHIQRAVDQGMRPSKASRMVARVFLWVKRDRDTDMTTRTAKDIKALKKERTRDTKPRTFLKTWARIFGPNAKKP